MLEGKTLPTQPQRSLAEVAPINERGGYLWSCNFAINAKLFRELSGFDERFTFACMEDVEFRERLLRRGEMPFFVPDAVVFHPWRLRDVRPEVRKCEAALGLYLSLHPERFTQFAPVRQFWAMARSFIRNTIPEMVRFSGKGTGNRVLYQWLFFIMTVRVYSRLRRFCATETSRATWYGDAAKAASPGHED